MCSQAPADVDEGERAAGSPGKEYTRSQAPADVDEGERVAGSPAKSAGSQKVDSLNAYPDETEKPQVQAQRMQNEKFKLREQLAIAFAEERRKADEQRLQFEEEKLRGNELRQILERQMLEMHQLQEEQRVRYKR